MTPATRLADELWDVTCARHPVGATLVGYRGRDGELGDYTEAGEAATAARVRDIVDRARALDPATLSTQDGLTRAVILAQGMALHDQVTAHTVEYTIAAYFTAPAAELLFALPVIGIVEPAQADGYLNRLRAIPGMLADLADRHRGGVAAGRLPVRRLVDAAIDHLDRHAASHDRHPLRRPGPPGDARAFAAERDRLVDGPVWAAFARYRDVLAGEIAAHGRPDERAGLCWLPDGETTYHRLIHTHTTVDRSADDLHRAGRELLDQLSEEYQSIAGPRFGRIGPAELFERLQTDPALRWRDGDEVLATARAAIARAEQAAPQWFGRLPGQGCLVEAVPPDDAPGAPPGNYLGAALDGSRPATYYANTHRATERSRHNAEAVAFHEVVPGHHVQVTLAHELTGLPALRRLAHIDAFAEGWALYAERLADEMGLYSDDIARIGMLAGDSVRAARLVADTGLHAFGWPRPRAIDYLRAHTPLPVADIEQEVDRYLADPGQALSYMVGRLEIERIRAGAERALGPRFDIRGFHDAVLANGEIPLGALAGVVENSLADQTGTNLPSPTEGGANSSRLGAR